MHQIIQCFRAIVDEGDGIHCLLGLVAGRDCTRESLLAHVRYSNVVGDKLGTLVVSIDMVHL